MNFVWRLFPVQNDKHGDPALPISQKAGGLKKAHTSNASTSQDWSKGNGLVPVFWTQEAKQAIRKRISKLRGGPNERVVITLAGLRHLPHMPGRTAILIHQAILYLANERAFSESPCDPCLFACYCDNHLEDVRRHVSKLPSGSACPCLSCCLPCLGDGSLSFKARVGQGLADPCKLQAIDCLVVGFDTNPRARKYQENMRYATC